MEQSSFAGHTYFVSASRGCARERGEGENMYSVFEQVFVCYVLAPERLRHQSDCCQHNQLLISCDYYALVFTFSW